MTDEQRMREQFDAFVYERTVNRNMSGPWPTPTELAWLAWQARDAEVQVLERVALNVMASLDAALSILVRSHEGKVPANEAVASDRMFTMMLDDYQKSLDAARV